jgi:hypothetical protein
LGFGICRCGYQICQVWGIHFEQLLQIDQKVGDL